MLRPTKPRLFNGDHVYSLSLDELKHNLQRAALRTVCAQPFENVTVFAIRWDYDGLAEDGTEISFRPGFDEMNEIWKEYGYKVTECVLPSGRGLLEYDFDRNDNARMIFIQAEQKFRRENNKPGTLVIYYYRGHGGGGDNDDEDPKKFHIASGDFVDEMEMAQAEVIVPVPMTNTRINYYNAMAQINDKRTFRARVLHITDSCASYRAVLPAGNALLAACGASEKAFGGGEGFNKALIEIMREALDSGVYVSVDGILEKMWTRIMTGSLKSFPVTQSVYENDMHGAIWLVPMPERTERPEDSDLTPELVAAMTLSTLKEEQTEVSSPADLKAKLVEDRVDMLSKRSAGSSVDITVRICNAELKTMWLQDSQCF